MPLLISAAWNHPYSYALFGLESWNGLDLGMTSAYQETWARFFIPITICLVQPMKLRNFDSKDMIYINRGEGEVYSNPYLKVWVIPQECDTDLKKKNINQTLIMEINDSIPIPRLKR